MVLPKSNPSICVVYNKPGRIILLDSGVELEQVENMQMPFLPWVELRMNYLWLREDMRNKKAVLRRHSKVSAGICWRVWAVTRT